MAMFSGSASDVSPLARSMLAVSTYRVFDFIANATCRQKDSLVGVLSSRELQCLTYLGRGLGDDEIAQLLGIKSRTVRFHLDSAKAKLGVTSRVQAISKVIRDGLVSI